MKTVTIRDSQTKEILHFLLNEDVVVVPKRIVEGAVKELNQLFTDIGGCDHEVGICACDLLRLADGLHECLLPKSDRAA